jgi:CTP:molybdopterin cytidylyltransferase MocA
MAVTGVVLAAGAGTRMGTPKALVVRDGTPWVARASRLLLEAGCERVVVVLGASADEAAALVPTDDAVSTVVNDDWPSGMASSLRAGLEAATGDAALISLVDTPGLPLEAVRRVLDSGAPLARAVYDGRPGHPVLIAASHWSAIADSVSGDHGARSYLEANGVADVECGDLWSGRDIDSLPPVLPPVE